MVKKILYLILLLLFLADTSYSFLQHYTKILDGDIAPCVVPAPDLKKVLADPFGFSASIKHQVYSNPNRYFCQISTKKYFETVPLALQNFTNPINSVYLSCAIIKILIQIFFIYFLALFISGTKNVFKLEFILSAVLVMPFFQTDGYCRYMGIIDQSITYTFFYALPVLFLVLYFSPVIQNYLHNSKIPDNTFFKVLWIVLCVMICLSSPINPGIIIVFLLIIFIAEASKINWLTKDEKISSKISGMIKSFPKYYWYIFLPACILSLYSLYVGTFNQYEYIKLSLWELYSKLPKGLYLQFFYTKAYPILFAILAINTFLLYKKYKTDESLKILVVLKWMVLFSVIYILLLPLGGYRESRPFVIRYDTVMPITLSLIFLFGISTLYLFKKMNRKNKIWYIPLIALVLIKFTITDKRIENENTCERGEIEKIANSKEDIVEVSNSCTVLAWIPIEHYGYSALNGDLLKIWRITDRKKFYYNKH